VFNIGLRLDVQLGNISHIFVFGVHVVYVARQVATAVFGEVAHLSTVKAGSFWAWLLVVGLSLDVRGIVVFWLGCICVDVVALVLASIIGSSGP
jgi:hypothetical protein